MGKVHYLNNHLQKFRENKIHFELDELEGIAQYSNIGESDPKIVKLFIKCFKEKINYRTFLNKLPISLSNIDRYHIITSYWFAYIVYYQNDAYESIIKDCLNDINENVVLMDSPHFCKKIYYYLNKPKKIDI